ncbi:hypothetical protein, partial [uncultured Pedobacter sp.]|uniref:hypothetical protein n=1 Tax=uncultured Pedobacter sp. TaxID=246139 RepID=UPI0025F395CD
LSKPSFQLIPSSEAGCKSRKILYNAKGYLLNVVHLNVTSWFSKGNIFRQAKTIMPFACLAPS